MATTCTVLTRRLQSTRFYGEALRVTRKIRLGLAS